MSPPPAGAAWSCRSPGRRPGRRAASAASSSATFRARGACRAERPGTPRPPALFLPGEPAKTSARECGMADDTADRMANTAETGADDLRQQMRDLRRETERPLDRMAEQMRHYGADMARDKIGRAHV